MTEGTGRWGMESHADIWMIHFVINIQVRLPNGSHIHYHLVLLPCESLSPARELPTGVFAWEWRFVSLKGF
jgi:hypothetical protein